MAILQTYKRLNYNELKDELDSSSDSEHSLNDNSPIR